MITRNRLFRNCMMLALTSVVLWGCPKKSEITSSPEAQRENASGTADAKSEAGKTGASTALSQNGKGETQERSTLASGGMQSIYFDYDKSIIRDDAKRILEANADWLKANPKVKIHLEGNCDEHGTREYNQALGQRRAASAKKFLTALGISANRMALISYGKEKPVCTESDENCWKKNRRDDLIVIKE